jgi:DNA-binding MurR/RpiR family transcriptional regulator
MEAPLTIEGRMRAALADLTRAERQLATHILSHFPVSALGSITALAKAAEVSTPTVVRLVQKLGYKGYPDYQQSLRAEVEAMLVAPMARGDRWAGGVDESHVLNRHADAVLANLSATLGQIDHAEFDRAAALIGDPGRAVFAMGGRLTHVMADYFVTLLKVARPGVTLISDSSNTWQPALLDMAPGDVLMVFDIRRYENTVLQVAELAAEQGAEVVLVTDRWISPAAAHARLCFAAHVDTPFASDSTVAILVLVETLVAAVQGRIWEQTEARMKRLEELYARARFFRRPRQG